jgi:type IV pilus assembly protein PilC
MTETREAVARRQFEFLLARGHSREEAESRLAAAGLPRPATDAEGPEGDALARRLRAQQSTLGRSFPAVEGAALGFRRDVAAALAPVWQSYRGIAVHFALVTVFAVLIVYTLRIYVLPQFAEMYQAFGADLPGLTRWVLTWSGGVVLPLVLLLLAVAVFLLPRRVRRQVELRIDPGRSPWPALLLGRRVGGLWAAYEIVYAQAAHRAGMAPREALDAAAAFAREWLGDGRSWPDTARAQAASAGALGTFEAELQHQLDEQWRELPIHAAARREWIALGASLLLGLYIGFVVIAIYLPIFKLASVL